MSRINTVSWKEFEIGSLFRVEKGTRLTKADMKDGDINFIGASAANNGITSSISNNEHLHTANTITITYNGSVGEAFYQDAPFWASDDVNVLYPQFPNNRHIAMFIIPVLKKAGQQYAFIDKWKKEDMERDCIKLPVDKTGNPDFSYMEAYMKNLEIRVSASLTKLESAKRFGKYGKVDTAEWREYRIKDIFPNVIKPVVYHTHEVQKAENGIPYVVRSKFNNGIKYSVQMPNGKINPARVISFGAENATFFYQKSQWVSGRDIYYIDTTHIDEYACLFITACLQPIAEKYSYNYGLFPDLLKEETIKLPAQANGEPNFDYMKTYMNIVGANTAATLKSLKSI